MSTLSGRRRANAERALIWNLDYPDTSLTPAKFHNCIFSALLLLGSLTACQGESERSPSVLQPTVSHNAPAEKTVVVPPEVLKSWRAVKIAVIDKQRATENIYEVPIGVEYHIPASKLTIAAEAFLPSFVMEGMVKTSSSNDLNNPGVKVRIVEGGKPVFNGWLFSRFPTTHAVSHPKFGFTLVGAVRFQK